MFKDHGALRTLQSACDFEEKPEYQKFFELGWCKDMIPYAETRFANGTRLCKHDEHRTLIEGRNEQGEGIALNSGVYKAGLADDFAAVIALALSPRHPQSPRPPFGFVPTRQRRSKQGGC